MAKMQATVAKNGEQGLTLLASRQGGCQSCAQKASCAVQWQPVTPETKINITSLNPSTKVGDSVEVSCDDRVVLNYISRLFLPSLTLLLLASLLLELLPTQLNPIASLLAQVIFPVAIGALISRTWLKSLKIKDLTISNGKPT